MTFEQFQAELSKLLCTVFSTNYGGNVGDMVEVELARQCSITTLSLVLLEKQKDGES